MFNKKFEDRLEAWRSFRKTLETANDPIQDTISLYSQVKTGHFNADPYDQKTWLGPWELLEENSYCEFTRNLAICYTLQLTDRFSQEPFEIHIMRDDEQSCTYYLFIIANRVIGFDEDTHVDLASLPISLKSQQTYVMPPLH